ncbi:cell division protein ZapA [Pseudidiomarina planktonica]|uniref:Cell division protein ZapA n=1 Tax=Pseudidiomarina planktonica TaxID=1323738 RepID=A0A1Y6G4A6_9GAMM|nr:cell division protein ZapA [Pseudidiomarina planktonica]RUO63307.1 cell division protein ZapA [Pseudidiomarina planktonica]SMQ80473.1 cell division protein ZapA [Pseudidiomarina planktonica]
MSARAMDITLMERSYRVSCPAGQEVALQQAADKLNERLQQTKTVTKLTNPEQIAVMTSLNLCHEWMQQESEQTKRIKALEEKISLLQETLEQVMAEQRPGRK